LPLDDDIGDIGAQLRRCIGRLLLTLCARKAYDAG
jgi:hypothetical protein